MRYIKAEGTRSGLGQGCELNPTSFPLFTLSVSLFFLFLSSSFSLFPISSFPLALSIYLSLHSSSLSTLLLCLPSLQTLPGPRNLLRSSSAQSVRRHHLGRRRCARWIPWTRSLRERRRLLPPRRASTRQRTGHCVRHPIHCKPHRSYQERCSHVGICWVQE